MCALKWVLGPILKGNMKIQKEAKKTKTAPNSGAHFSTLFAIKLGKNANNDVIIYIYIYTHISFITRECSQRFLAKMLTFFFAKCCGFLMANLLLTCRFVIENFTTAFTVRNEICHLDWNLSAAVFWGAFVTKRLVWAYCPPPLKLFEWLERFAKGGVQSGGPSKVAETWFTTPGFWGFLCYEVGVLLTLQKHRQNYRALRNAYISISKTF